MRARAGVPVVQSVIWLLALAPLAQAVSALPARSPQALARRAEWAAGCAFLVALGCAIAVFARGPLHSTLLGANGIGLSIYADRLSAVMLVLIAFIGSIVARFSGPYLEGDNRQADYTRRYGLTLAAALALPIAGNGLTVLLAWIVMGVGLQRLILLYPERRSAIIGARKNAWCNRASEFFLLLAFVIAFANYHTLELPAMFAAGSAYGASAWIAICIVLAGAFKSAQFPTHGWLTEVMETPTPVSALLHAGLINAGGFLILRFSGIVSSSVSVMEALSIIGAVTALFGSIVFLAQTSIKVSLAFSTVAQMGFMMLECGLGAFPAALLHIVAHSLYKAHAFLSSGSIMDIYRVSWTPSPGGRPHPARHVLAVVAVLALAYVLSRLFASSPIEQPAVFALGAVLLLGLMHLLVNAIDQRPSWFVVGRALAYAFASGILYFGLQYLMRKIFSATLPYSHAPDTPFAVGLGALVVLAFAAVTLAQEIVPGDGATPRWSALYAMCANGFYVNTLVNRFVLWTLSSALRRHKESV